MEGILKFDLNDPDERMDHLRCVRSADMALLLWEIEIRLRDNCKNILDKRKYNKYQTLDVVMSEIRELFHKHKIDLEQLIV